MPAALRTLPQDRIDLKAVNIVGVDAVQTLFDTTPATAASTVDAGVVAPVADAPLRDLVDEIESAGRGLVMCKGKRGVGKTTVAAALAERGHDVHLTTTDPAAHLAETLQGGLEHLHVSRIDPAEAAAPTATA